MNLICSAAPKPAPLLFGKVSFGLVKQRKWVILGESVMVIANEKGKTIATSWDGVELKFSFRKF
jgi:hypothetical protein